MGSRQSEQTVEHSQNARRHQTRQKRDASKAWHGRAGRASSQSQIASKHQAFTRAAAKATEQSFRNQHYSFSTYKV